MPGNKPNLFQTPAAGFFYQSYNRLFQENWENKNIHMINYMFKN